MSVEGLARPVTVRTFARSKAEGVPLAMLTAYDYTLARLVDASGVDAILVGDSAGNVMAGYATTVPVRLEQMIYHTQCVVCGVSHAMVIADMPFGTHHGSVDRVLDAGFRLVQEGGAQALKLEGGSEIIPSVRALVQAGVPVMGHLGLTPQSIHSFGGYGVRATGGADADRLLTDALALQEAGVFSLVLEKIPAALAGRVTDTLSIPTIGIGAGVHVDGQVLVLQDMLGMNEGFSPKFLRRYGQLGEAVREACSRYVEDVRGRAFPTEAESY